MFVTTDDFLGKEGQATEDRLVENAVGMVRDGANDLAIQLRVKDAGKRSQPRDAVGANRTACVIVVALLYVVSSIGSGVSLRSGSRLGTMSTRL